MTIKLIFSEILYSLTMKKINNNVQIKYEVKNVFSGERTNDEIMESFGKS